jgi:hypothetical protein
MYASRHYRSVYENQQTEVVPSIPSVLRINTDILRMNTTRLSSKRMEDIDEDEEDRIERKIEELKDEEQGPAMDPVKYGQVLFAFPMWALQTCTMCGKAPVDNEAESKMTVVQQRNIVSFMLVAGAVAVVLLLYVISF